MAAKNTTVANVTDMQNKLWADGWRWKEEIFGNGEVTLVFLLDPYCHAISQDECYPSRQYGWGRFDRFTAWDMACNFLVKEEGERLSIIKLKEYKLFWQNLISQYGRSETMKYHQTPEYKKFFRF